MFVVFNVYSDRHDILMRYALSAKWYVEDAEKMKDKLSEKVVSEKYGKAPEID